MMLSVEILGIGAVALSIYFRSYRKKANVEKIMERNKSLRNEETIFRGVKPVIFLLFLFYFYLSAI